MSMNAVLNVQFLGPVEHGNLEPEVMLHLVHLAPLAHPEHLDSLLILGSHGQFKVNRVQIRLEEVRHGGQKIYKVEDSLSLDLEGHLDPQDLRVRKVFKDPGVNRGNQGNLVFKEVGGFPAHRGFQAKMVTRDRMATREL
jgi:hypothetical protein